MNADDRTVSVICKTCGCPLAEVHAEYSPEHHRGLDDGTSGPVVTWWVRNEPLIATLQQLRQTNAETFRDELREQVGNRTVSRLTEICGDPLPIMGRDLRVPKSA